MEVGTLYAMRVVAAVCLIGRLVLAGCDDADEAAPTPLPASEGVAWRDTNVVILGVDSCEAFLKAEVVSTTSEAVHFRVEGVGASSEGCRESGLMCLEEPLGDRQLVDETSDMAVPVRSAAGNMVDVCGMPLDDSPA